MSDAVVVIPCFNEAARLDAGEVQRLADMGPRVLLVDDGSTDGTIDALQACVARSPARIAAMRLERNGGKAEAVRQGLLAELARGADVVGYLDADFATPPQEMMRVLRALDDPQIEVALGARVALLGRTIERKASRHYLGRVFATAASTILDLPVYDTQCGAKALRATPALTAALQERFHSRWAFDVELLGRLLAGDAGVAPRPPSAFVEVPLHTWRDVKGSKMSVVAMAKATSDLAVIAVELARRRKRAGSVG